MRTLVTGFLAFVLLVTLAACERIRPVLNLTDQPVPASASSLSETEMERQIRIAGAELNWEFEKLAPGALKGTLHVRTHTAVVDVRYNSREYNITLNSSVNLLEHNGQIHRSYNTWVTNLRDKIRSQLEVAGLQKS